MSPSQQSKLADGPRTRALKRLPPIRIPASDTHDTKVPALRPARHQRANQKYQNDSQSTEGWPGREGGRANDEPTVQQRLRGSREQSEPEMRQYPDQPTINPPSIGPVGRQGGPTMSLPSNNASAAAASKASQKCASTLIKPTINPPSIGPVGRAGGPTMSLPVQQRLRGSREQSEPEI
jgi:hypothetical protein